MCFSFILSQNIEKGNNRYYDNGYFLNYFLFRNVLK